MCNWLRETKKVLVCCAKDLMSIFEPLAMISKSVDCITFIESNFLITLPVFLFLGAGFPKQWFPVRNITSQQ